MNILVKVNKLTDNAIKNTPNVFEMKHPCVTFIAYSDTMKARILESMVRNPNDIKISETDEPARDGEWATEWED